MIVKKNKTPQKFAEEIEQYVLTHKMDYLDALMHYADVHNIETEVLASLVRQNRNLKEKLYSQCMDLSLVEKIATLV